MPILGQFIGPAKKGTPGLAVVITIIVAGTVLEFPQGLQLQSIIPVRSLASEVVVRPPASVLVFVQQLQLEMSCFCLFELMPLMTTLTTLLQEVMKNLEVLTLFA